MLPQSSPRLAGSQEVQRTYHQEKIKLLKNELNRLNVLEHPREIRDICNEIIESKKALEAISANNDEENQSSK